MSARRAAVVFAVAACAAIPAAARAEEPAAPPDGRPMNVDVRIQRFGLQGHRLVAVGTARIGLTDSSGATATTSRSVVFTTRAGGSCRVLTLSLDTLQLTLLGLRVDTSQVNLLITGEQGGGALGQLFCKLARGLRLPTRLAAARAARSLNHAIERHPLRPIGFDVALRPTTQPAVATAAQAAPPPGSCQVLDLVLGPLNLDLLGLRVDLYGATTTQPVRVLITADPAGGILGQVFCRLASGQAVT
jgi:hypothetical protein